MYIPSLLFGQANTCISGSGFQETGEFISGSQVWKYFKFTTQGSGSFVIDSGSTTNARVFLVAGGGGGGNTANNGTALNEVAGGGGGGGIVYTDYRLGAGSYTYYIGDGGTETNSGEDSWIQMQYLPSDYPYYDPTSTLKLTADGGGHGAYFLAPNSPSSEIDAGNGGSGGGGCASLRYSGGYLTSTAGGGRNSQGNDAGTPSGNLCVSIQEKTATGGGGAGAASDDTDCISSAGYQTPGGNGKFYIVDGTNTEYSCGGASMRQGTFEAATNDTQAQASRMYGAGGWGNSDSYSSTKKSGRPGIMVILVPVCRTDLFDCTTYDFDGGGTGGDITYIECGTSTLTTTSIEFQQTGSFCTYEITGEYPTSTGTVSLNATGSCSQDFPIPILPTCTPGQVTGSAFIYDIQVPTACYPSPASCQQIREASSTVTYTTYDGNAVTQSIGGGIGNGQFQVCAREYPAPTLSCGTIGGNSTPCSITKSSNICGYFCTSSV